MIHTVYEDAWLCIVDKPSGMPSQPDPSGDPDVFTALQARHPYVGLHHRLDRPASGLLVLTLKREVNAALADAFRRHAIQRTYAAVLAGDGLTQGDAGTWTTDIDGTPATSRYRILGAGQGLCAAALAPQTGRTHQLRKHAAQAGMPMVGDRRYGGDVGNWWPRLALHATRLGFTHPITGDAVDVHAPIPPDLEGLWRRAGGDDDAFHVHG